MTEPKRKALTLDLAQPLGLFRTPGGFLSASRWRFLSREVVNGLFQQAMIRSLKNEVKFLPRKGREDDPRVKDLCQYYRELFDKYAFDLLLVQWLQDSFDLPFGGALEVSWNAESGLPNGLWHVDAGTMLMNADSRYPFTQILQDGLSKPVAFRRREIARLIYNPHTDSRYYGYQRSCVEQNYSNICACGQLLEYDSKLLAGTPVTSAILNLGGWQEQDVVEWLKGFQELMLGGISPLKIPVIYENEFPVDLIELSEAQDTDKLWRHYIEKSGATYGLGIGDIQMYEHSRTLAGARITHLKSRRTGVGSFAWSVKKAVNRQLFPPGCPIQMDWDVPEIEDKLKLEQSRGTRVAYLSMLVTSGMLKKEDGLEQVLEDGILSIKARPGVIEPGITGLPAAPKPEKRYPEDSDAMAAKSEAVRSAVRVVTRSLLVEESPAFEELQANLAEQLFQTKVDGKRREKLESLISRISY